MNKIIKIIFTVSVLMNVILVGVLGGYFYKHHTKRMLSIPQELNEESRAKLENNIASSRKNMREQFKQMKVYHEKLKAIVIAEQFDIEAYNKTMENILDSKDEMARKRAQMMGNILSELPQEERKKMSMRLLKSLSHKNKRKDRFNHQK